MTPSPSDDQRFLELLQRWQSGDFTRQDEQVLRSLTESDDFRREAMEGFLALPEAKHQERLEALRQRLHGTRSPVRVLPMAQILAIAAAVLVLVVAIWFFPKTTKNESSPIAQTSAPIPPPAASAPPLPTAEKPAEDALADNKARQQPEKTAATYSADKQPAATSNADDQEMAAIMKDEVAAASEAAAPQATTPPAPATLSGPPGGGEISSAKKSKMAPAKASRSQSDTSNLAWNETEKKSDLERLRREARAEKEGPAQSEPADGWDVFNEYLRQNARLPLEARDHNISGSVRLQFSVNANGDAQNLVVLRSLGYGCDEEAKRLIQNWSWIRGQQSQVTVEVKFVR